MLAASAMRPAVEACPAAAPWSWASASSGDARMSIAAVPITVESLRTIAVLLVDRALPPGRSPSPLPLPPPLLKPSEEVAKIPYQIMLDAMLMLVARGEPYVAERKYHEDERLDDAYDGAERIERQRENHVRQTGENAEHGMIGEHVRVKTNAERKRPKEIVRQLDRQHQRSEEQHRSEKTPQIPRAIGAETLHDIEG